jgi:DNA polymerase-3 subunit beta
MQISFQRSTFQNAFSIASAVTSPRSPKDVLANVKIDVGPDKATLMATDMEAGIRIDLDNVEILTPGKALLPVTRFANILRETSDERLSLSSNDRTLDIKGLNSEFHLPNINPDTFPTIAPFEEQNYFEVEARLFRELVKRTVFATDVENTRYALGGVLLDMSDEQITAVATDGRRLAKMQGSGKRVGDFSTAGSNTIVPVKTLSLMEKSISDQDQSVQIAVRQNDILVRTGRCMIYSRLVEGRYPNWRQVIPQRTDAKRVESVCGPFHAAVRQASIVADQESRGVNFDFSPGNVVVQAMTAEVGESRIELPITYDGPEIKMSLSSQFVGDFFRVLDPDRTFSIDLSNEEEPAVFSTDDGYLNVVMPMARDR